MARYILATGLHLCFDSDGTEIPCAGTGQDGDLLPGQPWPEPRFCKIGDQLVQDRLTELVWSMDANLFSFPMTWQEGLETVRQLADERVFGRSDWRLPNRRELRSLISHGARTPALPTGHFFQNVFPGWYWTSTTFAGAPEYAWYVHMEGGRMFYGRKDSDYLVWPVCGTSTVLPATGQHHCYDQLGNTIDCAQTGQDGDLQTGILWSATRFTKNADGIHDRLTGLTWYADANPTGTPVSWGEALTRVAEIARHSKRPWRMPTINELESLVDGSRRSPALSSAHPFHAIQEAYWSSTTSFFEPCWSYVLYLYKGAVGVGYKNNRDFALWPVLDQG